MSEDRGPFTNAMNHALNPSSGHKTSTKRSTAMLPEGTPSNGHKVSRRSLWRESDIQAPSETIAPEPFVIMALGTASEDIKSSGYLSSTSIGEEKRFKDSRNRGGRSPSKLFAAVSDGGDTDARPHAKPKKYLIPTTSSMLPPSTRSQSLFREKSSGQSSPADATSTATNPEIEALFLQVTALELSIRNEFASFNRRQFSSLLDLVSRLKNTLQPQAATTNQGTYITPQVSSDHYMRLGREYQDAGTQTTRLPQNNARGGTSGENRKRVETSRPRKCKLPVENKRQHRNLSRTPPHQILTSDFSVINIGGRVEPDLPPETWHSHLDLLRSLDDSEEELRLDSSSIAASPSHLEHRGLAGPCPIEMLQGEGEENNSAKSDEATSRDSPFDDNQTPSPRKSWTSSARWSISPRKLSLNDYDENRSCEESSEGSFHQFPSPPTTSSPPMHLSPASEVLVKPCASPLPDVQCPTTRRLNSHSQGVIEDLNKQIHRLSLPFQPGVRSAFAPKRLSEQGA